jgi:hypothetical protein
MHLRTDPIRFDLTNPSNLIQKFVQKSEKPTQKNPRKPPLFDFSQFK